MKEIKIKLHCAKYSKNRLHFEIPRWAVHLFEHGEEIQIIKKFEIK